MSRRQLYQDLAAVRALVADGGDRLYESIGDVEQFWISSARSRLAAVDDCLIGAAGELGGWPRTLAATPAMLAGAALTALVTAALGGSPFWVVTCSWIVAVLIEFPVRRRLTRLGPRLGRRRLGRAAPPRAKTPTELGDPAGLPRALERARVRLVSIALREAGPKNWRAPYLARAVAREPVMFRLAEADMLLCQAIDYLEVYLAADPKGPA